MSMLRIFLSVIAVVLLATTPSAAQTLAEALDQETWTFTTGGEGESPWFGQTTESHNGGDAAQAGTAEAMSSWMETTRSLASSGTVSFWWKKSGNRSLAFFVNGVVVASASATVGAIDWTYISWVVPAGEHVFRWDCSEPSGVTGENAWVDQVSFVTAGTSLRSLTVTTTADTPGAQGTSMVIAPPDLNALSGGETPLTRIYADGESVEIEASELSVSETGFIDWSGCDSAEGRTCRVTLTSDRTVVARYLPTPSLLWDDRVGGTALASDNAGGIARGPDGSVWATGTVYDRGGRTGRVARVWLGKYSADGSLLWETRFPGEGRDVAVARDGFVYVTGTMSGKLLLRKFSPDGGVVWTRTGSGVGKGVAVSPDGESVYVAGAVAGNVLLRKYSSFGGLVWTRTYNGSENRADEGRRVAVAEDGGVFVVGAVRRAGKGQSAWIGKYSPAGSVLWMSFEDGTGAGDDWASGLTLSAGRLYVAGSQALSVNGSAALHRHHWMAAYSEEGIKAWAFARSCLPDSAWSFESSGVAASPLGTIDFVGSEYIGQRRSVVMFRLKPEDGSPLDMTENSWSFPVFRLSAAVGVVAGEDGCYFIGRGYGDLDSPVGKDIFIGKYDAVAPVVP